MAPRIVEWRLGDETDTVRLAAAIADRARPGDVIGLAGPLGVGKTRFARAFIERLAAEAEEVPSPTFTLVQTYDLPAGTIWHFDLYRLDKPEDAWELGIEEAFAEGIALVEWPERLGALMPQERLDIALDFAPTGGPNARIARLAGHRGWAARIEDLAQIG
jgi:tRNA threonylcarbamoyladenosine biosynthesis protein TsaE